MTAAVIIHSTDHDLANGLVAQLDEVGVVHTTSGDDLGRTLTGTDEVAVMVAHLSGDAERGWQRLAVIREAMPRLPIVAYLDPGVAGWDDSQGPSPATAVVRGPAQAEELSRVVRVTGRLLRPTEAAPEAEERPLRAIAVVGMGGGVGATTIAALLTMRLSMEEPCVLADLDSRHGVQAEALRVEPTYTADDLRPLVGDPARLDDALPVCLTEVREHVRLLAGAEHPAAGMDERVLRPLVGGLCRLETALVVDFGDLPQHAFGVLAPFTDLMLVASPDVVSVRRLRSALGRLAEVAAFPRVRRILNGTVDESYPDPVQLARAVGERWDAVLPHHPPLLHTWNDTAGPGLSAPAGRSARAVERHLSPLLDLGAVPHQRRRFATLGLGSRAPKGASS